MHINNNKSRQKVTEGAKAKCYGSTEEKAIRGTSYSGVL